MNKSGGVLSMIANYEYLPGGGNIVITGMILSWVLKSMLKNESFTVSLIFSVTSDHIILEWNKLLFNKCN